MGRNPPCLVSGPNRRPPPKLFFEIPHPGGSGSQPAPHGDDQTQDRPCCELRGQWGISIWGFSGTASDFIFPLLMGRYAMDVPEGENSPLVLSSCSRDRRVLRVPGPYSTSLVSDSKMSTTWPQAGELDGRLWCHVVSPQSHASRVLFEAYRQTIWDLLGDSLS